MATSPTVLKAGLVIVGLCIAGYVVGPPLYWHFMEGLSAVSFSSSSSFSFSCPPCTCDCSSQPLLSIPISLSNISIAACARCTNSRSTMFSKATVSCSDVETSHPTSPRLSTTCHVQS
ncbi:hypothetical protein ACFX2G_034941 [Malus domestica]